MNRFLQDMRFAVRHFTANPTFALILILTLALGIGPNCIIFTILDSIYFKPFPYKNQQRLVLLSETNLVSGNLVGTHPYTLRQWQAHSRTLEEMAAYRSSGFNLNLDNRPEAFPGQYVSERFLPVLGMTPAIGRDFQPEDFVESAPRAVIISHGLWMDYFSSRSDIIGLSIRLNGNPVTVIGVMPSEFKSFMEGRVARLWAPHVPVLTGDPESLDTTGAVARLRRGVSAEQARAELGTIAGELKRQYPAFYAQRGVSLRDFKSSQFAGLGPGITVLCMMVGLVLLIACGNAANLLLARAVARGREMAIRIALGAGRPRLMRQLLTENLLFSLSGGAVGLLLAFWGVDFIWNQTASIFQAIGTEKFQIDRRILLFTMILSVLTTVLFGVMPAWRCSHIQPNSVIKEQGVGGAGRGRRNRLSRALVVFQVTLCMVSLLGTALMIRSFLHFAELSGNPGFRTENLLVGSMPFERGGTIDSAKWRDLCQELQSRVAGLAGVQKTALADRLPFLESGAGVHFIKEDSESLGKSKQEREIQAQAQLVSSGYFEVLAIPVVKGRPISDQDNQKAPPVAVINETLARAYWRESDPIGQRILLEGEWKTVVGIASNPLRESPLSPSPRQIYLPYLQSPAAGMKIIIYSKLDPLGLIPAVREELRLSNPDQPLMEVRTMESALSRFMIPFRLILSLMTFFGLIALVLAGVGLYGVISQMVANRTHEIGIRRALGATSKKIQSMILIHGIRLAGLGLVLGLFLGRALIKVLPSQILGVGSLPTIYFLLIPAILWLLSALACLVPAHRAASVEPMKALRHE